MLHHTKFQGCKCQVSEIIVLLGVYSSGLNQEREMYKMLEFCSFTYYNLAFFA